MAMNTDMDLLLCREVLKAILASNLQYIKSQVSLGYMDWGPWVILEK